MNHYTTFYQVKKDYRFACAFHSTRKLFINATSFQKKKKKKGGKKFPIVSLDFFPALLVCFHPTPLPPRVIPSRSISPERFTLINRRDPPGFNRFSINFHIIGAILISRLNGQQTKPIGKINGGIISADSDFSPKILIKLSRPRVLLPLIRPMPRHTFARSFQ